MVITTRIIRVIQLDQGRKGYNFPFGVSALLLLYMRLPKQLWQF